MKAGKGTKSVGKHRAKNLSIPFHEAAHALHGLGPDAENLKTHIASRSLALNVELECVYDEVRRRCPMHIARSPTMSCR
jgi:hypothetical protein